MWYNKGMWGVGCVNHQLHRHCVGCRYRQWGYGEGKQVCTHVLVSQIIQMYIKEWGEEGGNGGYVEGGTG